MSNFEENPFGDPEASNPFADPSVQQNTWNQQKPAGGGLDDFNPFADGNTQTRGASNVTGPSQGAAAAPLQPAVMQATQEPPPPYTSSAQAQAQAATDDLKRRQDELERKAAELQRKEQELQRNLGHTAYSCLLFLNVLGCMAYFIAASKAATFANSAGTTFGVSILYLVLFTPCSFVCWYRPAYKAFRSDSSFNFFMFFFVFFFQFLFCILQALGIDGWGTVGFLNGLQMVGEGGAGPIAMGLVMLFMGIFFGLLAIVVMVSLIKVHRIYRTTGASFAKAQQEVAQGVMSNKNVQQVASDAGSAAVRGAMSQQAADNRY